MIRVVSLTLLLCRECTWKHSMERDRPHFCPLEIDNMREGHVWHYRPETISGDLQSSWRSLLYISPSRPCIKGLPLEPPCGQSNTLFLCTCQVHGGGGGEGRCRNEVTKLSLYELNCTPKLELRTPDEDKNRIARLFHSSSSSSVCVPHFHSNSALAMLLPPSQQLFPKA